MEPARARSSSCSYASMTLTTAPYASVASMLATSIRWRCAGESAFSSRYELTVRDNVLLGRPDAEADDVRVLHALRRARSDRLVSDEPGALSMKVGRLFEGGHDLSGGEWQRLALARLLYRDAEVWVL